MFSFDGKLFRFHATFVAWWKLEYVVCCGMSSTRKIHPALALFKELFEMWATPDNPDLPEYIVSRCPFRMELRRRGIEHPDNFIKFCEWEEEIGLRKFAKKVIAAYRRQVKARQEEAARQMWVR